MFMDFQAIPETIQCNNCPLLKRGYPLFARKHTSIWKSKQHIFAHFCPKSKKFTTTFWNQRKSKNNGSDWIKIYFASCLILLIRICWMSRIEINRPWKKEFQLLPCVWFFSLCENHKLPPLGAFHVDQRYFILFLTQDSRRISKEEQFYRNALVAGFHFSGHTWGILILMLAPLIEGFPLWQKLLRFKLIR